MQRLGYIHDMMDVKVLILYVMARCEYALSVQEIYELCYQDDCLSYFDVCTAIPEMVTSGHLSEENGKFTITEKGRTDGDLVASSIAFTVKQRAQEAVNRYNLKIRRSNYVRCQVVPREGEEQSVIMTLDDDKGNLMTLELLAPDRQQAVRLSRLLEKKAEMVYNMTMTVLLDDEEDDEI